MLKWLADYLRARKQCTVVNGTLSDNADVTFGIPQGSVLGPILFTLYTNNLPESITSATVYMYADDTTIFCIGQSADEVTIKLNKALEELHIWCKLNTLTPHPTKCEALILQRQQIIGPLNELKVGQDTVKWVSQTRLLGVTIDNKLSWSRHIQEVKKSFAKKLSLIKRSQFLPRDMLLDLYFKIIFPSVTYAIQIWGGCTNKEDFNKLESLHRRAARLIFSLPSDMPSMSVLEKVKWKSLYDTYKVRTAVLIYKIYFETTPQSMTNIITKHSNKYSSRSGPTLIVPRFNTYYLKNYISYRGSVIWNLLATHLQEISNVKAYAKMAKKSIAIKSLTFTEESPQTAKFRDIDFIYH